MEHRGGCHCGNLRLTLRLTQEPGEVRLRACGCSFCRRHNTRTASDPNGAVEIVYRRELRPLITTGAEIMDQLFSGS